MTLTASGALVGRPPGPATCQLEDCGRPGPTVRGMCKRHYSRWQRAAITAPPRKCDTCCEMKPITDFHRRAVRNTDYTTCFPCRKAQRPERYGERQRDWQLRKSYGISLDEYNALLARQGGGCAICGRSSHGEDRYALHVDHDHTTGMVRGILCARCNQGLGHFLDSQELLTAALKYLE